MTQNSSLESPGFENETSQVGPIELSEDQKVKLAQWIKSEYQKMKSARSKIQHQWYHNLAMYYGQQYMETFNSKGFQELGVAKKPRWRVRQKVNLIRPAIRTEISRMTSQKPSATSVPATTSDDDMFAAQAGQQTWDFIQQRSNFQHVLQRAAFWTSITGTGFTKTWWDNDYIDSYTLDAQSKQPATGNIRIKPSTPFNIFVPDLLEEDIEEQPYVFEAYTKSVAWIKQFWGIDTKPNVISKSEIIEASQLNLPGGNDAKPDAVLVIEAWVKPGATELVPEGGIFTLVGDKIAGASTMYSHKQYPFAKIIHIPTEKFYGDSVLVDLNDLQKEYNRTRSQIVESKNRMARPQLIAPIGSFDPKRYTSEPGLIVPYKPGLGKPEPLPMQGLPSYVLEEQDRIKQDMEDISGQHSVSRGQAPGSGVTAATAISFLQERDDSIMGPTYASIEQAVEKTARQTLSLVVDYWELPRIVEVTGLDQAFDSLELKGSDIINGRNIRIEGGSSLPQSKAARQALLMDMAKMGFITGNQMLDMLDIGGVQKLTEKIRVDLRQAQRENLKMKRITEETFHEYMQNTAQNAMQGGIGTTDPQNGLPLLKTPNLDPETGEPIVDPEVYATFPPMIPVNSFDNHAVHKETHNNYRKSQEYDTLPDFTKDQFDKHVDAHEFALEQQQMQQQMQQMMMGGEMPPPEGGGPQEPSGGGSEGAEQGPPQGPPQGQEQGQEQMMPPGM